MPSGKCMNSSSLEIEVYYLHLEFASFVKLIPKFSLVPFFHTDRGFLSIFLNFKIKNFQCPTRKTNIGETIVPFHQLHSETLVTMVTSDP